MCSSFLSHIFYLFYLKIIANFYVFFLLPEWKYLEIIFIFIHYLFWLNPLRTSTFEEAGEYEERY